MKLVGSSGLPDCPQNVHRKCRKAMASCLSSARDAGATTTYRNYPSGSWVTKDENFGGSEFISGVDAMTKDPVCGMKVDENNKQYQSQYGGQTYQFCSDQCKKKFDQQPEQYAKSAA